MNVLLVVCDTLRADHLGYYGYFRKTSSNIDSLAKEGVLFEDFYSAGCPTGPGFTSMITGLHTIHHKYYQFMTQNIRQVDDTVFTIAEIMRAMGYTTLALDNLVTQPARAKHFVRGYEFYINCGPYTFSSPRCLKAEDLNRRLIPWVKAYSSEKFFLFAHYWDPHLPYNQPDEYKNLFQHEAGNPCDLEVREAPAGYKYVPGWGTVDQIAAEERKWQSRFIDSTHPSVDLYDGEIAYMDCAIGDVVETLEDEGVLDETLVIVTSDHGEQLGQHYNTWGHDGLHDADTHLPLIMRYPKMLPKGVRVKGFCQQIDIMPTIMELAGQKPDILDIDGISVLPLLKGKAIRDKVFMEHSNAERAVRVAEWKLLDNEWATSPYREMQLFNVVEDPMEMMNLAGTNSDEAQDLRDTLCAWVRSNLKEGERDPAVYDDMKELNEKAGRYRQKVSQLLEALEKVSSRESQRKIPREQ